jgi:DNA adenine methylase
MAERIWRKSKDSEHDAQCIIDFVSFGEESLALIATASDIVNVASVPHRSPFRYPGGKTWLVPRVREWLTSIKRPTELIEPFAGGGIVGLSAVFDDLVERIRLVELDSDVAAVWTTILNGSGERLATDIMKFAMNAENVRHVVEIRSKDTYERAFATIIRNRVNRGGILAPGVGLMKNGENGRGLLSRWYPETLSKRITAITNLKERVTFIQADGLKVLSENADRADAVFFIDPPYTVAGRRLYSHSEIDHARLFDIATTLCGDFLITYDNSPEIAYLARKAGLQTKTVPMKSTHHSRKLELLIGRNLGWVSS